MKTWEPLSALIPILIIITFNLIPISTAHAESEAACKQYANGAINSYKQAKSLNCPSISGPRWQDNYNNHYGWCLNAPAEALTNENNIRASLIKLCQKEPNALRCDQYADKAVAQGEEARARNCGMENTPRWTASYENHLNWCINNPPSAAENETKQREGPLSRCRTTSPLPGGGTGGITSPGNKLCASGCDACEKQGLSCRLSSDCSSKNTNWQWACY